MSSYDLTAPGGTKVTVEGAGRRDTLLARGYTESGAAKPAPSAPKERTVETKAGSNDTVTVNSETGKSGRK